MKMTILPALSLAVVLSGGICDVCRAYDGDEGSGGVIRIFNNDYYAEQEAEIAQIKRALLQSGISREAAFKRAQEMRRYLKLQEEINKKNADSVDAKMRSLPLDQYEQRDRYLAQHTEYCAKAAKASVLIRECEDIMDMCRM